MPKVPISKIQIPKISELNPAKIHALEHSFDSFEAQLNSRSEPIALDMKSGIPYQIINGRHRVFLANKKGIKELDVVFA